ncbi:MAG: hypothetical protein KKC37_09280, partial [Proteobacteria bacterium]|nr:hypothetical protein [Pseudomonadota bacterium]
VPRLVIRADGNERIGGGHLKRQADLAHYAVRRGWSASLVTLSPAGPLLDLFRRVAGPEVKILRAGDEVEAGQMIAQSGPDVLVVDILDAELRPDYLGGLRRKAGAPVVAFSDAPDHRPGEADLIVNANPCRLEEKAAAYRREGTKAFLGPGYFLLGEDLRDATRQPAGFESRERRMVLAFGGADRDNAVGRTLSALLGLAERMDYTFDVLLSPVSPWREQNRDDFGVSPRVVFHADIPSVVPLLCRARLLVGTHGNIAYEAMAVGLPMLALSHAPGQVEQASEMHRRGAVNYLGPGEAVEATVLAEAARELLLSPERWAATVRVGRAVVDGRGLERLFVELRRLLVRTPTDEAARG